MGPGKAPSRRSASSRLRASSPMKAKFSGSAMSSARRRGRLGHPVRHAGEVEGDVVLRAQLDDRDAHGWSRNVPGGMGESTRPARRCYRDTVLVPVRDLVRRWRGPRSRARDVDATRSRIDAAAKRGGCEEATALARELRELKPAVLAAFADVRACSGCGRGTFAAARTVGRRVLLRRAHRGSLRRRRVGRARARRHATARSTPAGGRPRRLRLPRPGGLLARRPSTAPTLCVRFICRELEEELRDERRVAAREGAHTARSRRRSPAS